MTLFFQALLLKFFVLRSKDELKLQFLYYYQWNIQMIYCTLLLIEATKWKVQASKQAGTSNFLDVLAKIIFAIVLFGKLLMDPDKIPKDNSVFWQRFITSLLRLCLVRFFDVKCLLFFYFYTSTRWIASESGVQSIRAKLQRVECSYVWDTLYQIHAQHIWWLEGIAKKCIRLLFWSYVERGSSVQNQQRRDRPGVGGIAGKLGSWSDRASLLLLHCKNCLQNNARWEREFWAKLCQPALEFDLNLYSSELWTVDHFFLFSLYLFINFGTIMPPLFSQLVFMCLIKKTNCNHLGESKTRRLCSALLALRASFVPLCIWARYCWEYGTVV